MICIVLAAGYATRLYPLTENFPKPLLEIKGKSILDHLLVDLDNSGKITKYIVVSNHRYFEHFENWRKAKKLSGEIVVLDDGAVVGIGKHEELLDSCSVYREIYNSQFKGGEAR